MPRRRIVQMVAAGLRTDYIKVVLFAGFLLWQLPSTGWIRRLLLLFTGKMCVQLGIFSLLHFVRFSIRHLSRRFLTDHLELLPNLDSPRHGFRQSFQPLFVSISKCAGGVNERSLIEKTSKKEKRKLTSGPIYTFIRTSRKKSRHA